MRHGAFRLFALLGTAASVLAQSAQPAVSSPADPAPPVATPPPFVESVRDRMNESIEKQRESVRRQIPAGAKPQQGWFTTPWQPSAPLAPMPAAQPRAACSPARKDGLEPQIQSAALREGYAPEILRAVIETESAFYPCAVSPKGAQGLMQLMPTTAAALGVGDPFDPVENINGGAHYLGQLLQRYSGDLRLALGAYNAGPRRIDAMKDIPPIPETEQYVERILKMIKPAKVE